MARKSKMVAVDLRLDRRQAAVLNEMARICGQPSHNVAGVLVTLGFMRMLLDTEQGVAALKRHKAKQRGARAKAAR